MKRTILFLLAVTTLSFAGSILEGSIQARSDGNNVTVQWGSTDESDVLQFVVERRGGLSGDFSDLAIVGKKGSNSYYEYIDQTAFKSTASIYQYRIKTVFLNGGFEFSKEITVSHNVSSVKRTWGSLKAMFR
jgi:hypothetical protein